MHIGEERINSNNLMSRFLDLENKNFGYVRNSNISPANISWEYPKVCVNLQTDVR